jgi:hypothetical protein
MGWATFRTIFSKAHLVTLKTLQKVSFQCKKARSNLNPSMFMLRVFPGYYLL